MFQDMPIPVRTLASEVVLRHYNNGALSPASNLTIQATSGYKILGVFLAESRINLKNINRTYYMHVGVGDTISSSAGKLSTTYSVTVTYANDRKSVTINTTNASNYIAYLEVPENTDLSTIDDFINS